MSIQIGEFSWKKLISLVNCITIIFLLIVINFSLPINTDALVNKEKLNKQSAFQKNLREKDPTSAQLKTITKNERDNSFLLDQIKGNDSAKFDLNSKSLKLKYHGKNFSIKDVDSLNQTAELNSDTIVRYNQNGEIKSTIESVDGGIRIVLNITNSNSNIYTYDFLADVEGGGKYYLESNGSATLKTLSGETVVNVLQPWAKDSTNKALKTWYSVENSGNILRQHVDLTEANFPVIADPTWCGSIVQSEEWRTLWDEGGKISLHIIPTWCGRNFGYNSNTFQEVVDKAPYYPYGPNYWEKYTKNDMYWSMYNQFICHTWFARDKPDWNLEPWRPNVGYTRTVLSKCNP